MPQGRRINRIHEPNLKVKVRLGPTVEDIELWREDHFEYTAHDPDKHEIVTQRYIVLDFGREQRAHAVIDPDAPRNAPRPKVDETGEAIIEWADTGAVQVELQRVNDDGGGMALPLTKMFPPIRLEKDDRGQREFDPGWLGWLHIPDSQRRPTRHEFGVRLEGGIMDIGGNPEFVQELADGVIAEYKATDNHVGLSVNFSDRRCYVCDEVWPCDKATDFEATRDLPEDVE